MTGGLCETEKTTSHINHKRVGPWEGGLKRKGQGTGRKVTVHC